MYIIAAITGLLYSLFLCTSLNDKASGEWKTALLPSLVAKKTIRENATSDEKQLRKRCEMQVETEGQERRKG